MKWKRWWGVRHVRYWWIRKEVWHQARAMSDYGLGCGIPNIHDLINLELIWRGKK